MAAALLALSLVSACSVPASAPATTVASRTAPPIWPGPPRAATLVLTPAPSPMPVPPPPYFTEEFETEPWAWETVLTGLQSEPGLRVSDDYLIFELTQPNQWAYRILTAHTYSDVRIDARFEPRASEPSSTGLVCRYDPIGGWYEFNVSRDGHYGVLLGEWAEPGIATYLPLLYDDSEYIEPTLAAFEIGLACLHDTLWLYINGKLIRKLDVSGFGLVEGRIGLAVASFENLPVITAFDWVRVSAPE